MDIKEKEEKDAPVRLPTLYQEFIHKSKYSRWLPEENRREEWHETVQRYVSYFAEHTSNNTAYTLTEDDQQMLFENISELRVMPSMRALFVAGPALTRDNCAAYNCSYLRIDRVNAFDEIMYILMNGTGVGFSVERQYINRLPKVPEKLHESNTIIHVRDSKVGWATAFKELIALLYIGTIPKWDISKVRCKGKRLKTFGGRSSGPEPLVALFEFTVAKFKTARGRKLQSIEAHDVVCKIAEIVIVGATRRSALISLSNLSDERMRAAKTGQWWMIEPQRALANNSVCYTEKPDVGRFMHEWLSLYESKSGERGIYNRESVDTHIERVCKSRKRKWDDGSKIEWGTNPCSEINLRDSEFCNLSECIIRKEDDQKSIMEKVRVATIIGTLQSTLTNFRYLSPSWKINCDEERLLGVSLTGIMDNKFMSTPSDELKTFLNKLRAYAEEVNIEWAEMLGINASAAITCVKPSGSVSQLCNTASGIHARHSDYYIRTVRGSNIDPLCSFVKGSGVPSEPCVVNPIDTTVFSFPVKSPDGSVTRDKITAIDQLKLVQIYNLEYCHHKVSCTISVGPDEWFKVGSFVYDHFDSIGGISFLPRFDHIYQQAPYQDCDKEKYEAETAKMPKTIKWRTFMEIDDTTEGPQNLACTAGGCQIR